MASHHGPVPDVEAIEGLACGRGEVGCCLSQLHARGALLLQSVHDAHLAISHGAARWLGCDAPQGPEPFGLQLQQPGRLRA
eukprot:8084350-Lingulodinium_polyedra.AAC.1